MHPIRIAIALAAIPGLLLMVACSGDDVGGNLENDEPRNREDAAVENAPSPPDEPSDAGAVETPSDAGSKSVMTFFVTSTGSGTAGGNLGGLAGADKKCNALAAAAGGGDHTWAAYLVTADDAGVHEPEERIGAGPWKNQKGVLVAKDLAALRDPAFNIPGADILDEKGKPVPADKHAILVGKRTGSLRYLTCENWTSKTSEAAATFGFTDSDTSKTTKDFWNRGSQYGACTPENLALNGDGRFYCFAKD